MAKCQLVKLVALIVLMLPWGQCLFGEEPVDGANPAGYGIANRLSSTTVDVNDKSMFRIGVQTTTLSTDVRLDSSTTQGTNINFEDTLGMDDDTSQYSLGLRWRIGSRSYVEFSYLAITRDTSGILTEDVEWGDLDFPSGSVVSAFFNSRYAMVAYRQVFTRRHGFEFGASAGFNVASLSTGLSTVHQDNTLQRDNASVTAPVPLVGVFGSWRYAPRAYLRGAIQYIKLSVSDISGSMTDYEIATDYYFNGNFGVGLGYHFNNLIVDSINTSDFDGRFDYRFSGLLAYGSYAF